MYKIVPTYNIIKFYAAAWIAGYLTLFLFFKNMLPEKYFRDSITIMELANEDNTENWGGAFNIAAAIAHALPVFALDIIVMVIGSAVIWMVITSLRTYRGMAIIVPLLVPMIVLDMLAFGKEVFVIPLTFIILTAVRKSPNRVFALAAIGVIYVIYGTLFREYYLLILAVLLGYMLMIRSPLIARVMYVLAFLALLIVTPGHIFNDLQGSRDQINFLSNFTSIEVRTSIYNPFSPDNGWHFLVNYAYAFLFLNVPWLFEWSVNEVILFFNVLVYSWLIYMGIKRRPLTPANYLPWLFLSHITVLIIFEPDSGSYFRHFSSVMLYLVPTLLYVEQLHAAKLVARAIRRA